MKPVVCPVCGGHGTSDAAFGVPLHHCPACDLRYRGDVGSEWSDGYAADAGGYASRRQTELIDREAQRRLEAASRAEWVTRRVPAGSLLEVGCAAGEFLDAARRRGLEVRGLEASPRLSAIARERYGLVVDQGLAERQLGGTELFDAVCMWHVLEHAPHPGEVLAAAAAALKPDGLLFLEVPNIASAGARALGSRWPSLDFDEHAVHFSPRALAAALRASGLAPVELTTILPWEYLSPRDRFRLRKIGGRAHRALVGRTMRAEHPTNGDYLRAIAQLDDRHGL